MGGEQFALASEMNYMVKGRFKAGSQNIYGLMLLQFTYDGDIISSNIVSTSYSDIYNLSIDSPWFTFEENITKYKWKGSFNSAMTTSLQAQFEKLKQDTSYRSQVFGYIAAREPGGLNASLYDLINRIIHDKQLVLDVQIELVSNDQIMEVKRNRQSQQVQTGTEQPQFSSSSSFNLVKGAMIIPGGLILSPVKGKPIYDLKIGDRILIKIDPSTQSSQQFINLYQLRVDNRIKPVPAEVVDIKAESRTSPVEILCKLDNIYFAKCVEEERQVKLRLYDPRIDGVINFDMPGTISGKPLSRQSGTSSPTMIALVATLTFLLVVFILIIYIMM